MPPWEGEVDEWSKASERKQEKQRKYQFCPQPTRAIFKKMFESYASSKEHVGLLSFSEP